jgi:flagellin-like protein
MRRLRRSEHGLSEIVGTLMLVIIVVTAATLLAAFVASYQKQLQAEQAFTHDQNLESLRILGLNTTVRNGSYTTFGFTLASKYVNPSSVLNITINSQPLKFFNWSDVAEGTKGHFRGGALNLSPFEEVYIALDLNPASSNFSFFGIGSVPLPNHYLVFNVYTLLQNDFTQIYLPPTPLAVVSDIDLSAGNPITLLDGSTSFQSGGNSSIVDWAWTVTGGSFISTVTAITTPVGGDLVGSVSGAGNATFRVPAGFVFTSAESLAFASGQPTTSSPTCSLAAVTFAPTAEVVRGTNLTVNFTYTAVAGGAGCSSGPSTQLTSTGVVLTLSADGEEVELSPSLIPGSNPYVVTLTITDSIGLQATVSVLYSPP